jgi:hypothetical protein
MLRRVKATGSSISSDIPERALSAGSMPDRPMDTNKAQQALVTIRGAWIAWAGFLMTEDEFAAPVADALEGYGMKLNQSVALISADNEKT